MQEHLGYDLVGQNSSWGRSSGHKVYRLLPGSDNAGGIDLKKRSYIHLDKQRLYMYGIQVHLRPVNFYRGLWLTFGAGIWLSSPFWAHQLRVLVVGLPSKFNGNGLQMYGLAVSNNVCVRYRQRTWFRDPESLRSRGTGRCFCKESKCFVIEMLAAAAFTWRVEMSKVIVFEKLQFCEKTVFFGKRSSRY